MKSRRVVAIWTAFQILVVIAMVAAVILLDDDRQLGLLEVFRHDDLPGAVLGIVAVLLFGGGTWWLLSCESYEFRIGDSVSSPVGPGTVRRRSRLHGQPVYDIQFDGGTPVTFLADELKRIPRPSHQRPWYRPRGEQR